MNEHEDDVDDVISLWMNVDWTTISNRSKVVFCVFLNSVEYNIDFVRQMFEILFFSIILILH
jgi:hypothetical protein